MTACWECGGPPPLHDHHVVPRSRGGTRTVPLCEPCHGLVHGRQMRTSDLTRAAMRSMADRGLYTGGRAPYGYRPGPDGQLEQDPGEQAIIGKIRRLRDAGLSYRAIVGELERAGLRNRTGSRFHPNAIGAVLGGNR